MNHLRSQNSLLSNKLRTAAGEAELSNTAALEAKLRAEQSEANAAR